MERYFSPKIEGIAGGYRTNDSFNGLYLRIEQAEEGLNLFRRRVTHIGPRLFSFEAEWSR
jgi:hypothetical protein